MEILKSTRVRWRFVLDILVQFYLGEINLYTDNIVTNTAIRTLNSQADFFKFAPGLTKHMPARFLPFPGSAPASDASFPAAGSAAAEAASSSQATMTGVERGK